ncbi:hypothetical protein GDO86_016254 [Hymenochirus boettgeri]|uniref:C-type lectin domain-containing protein n=1 Tax=Hymenochirus boettgeri TaxID=247094 RepID=A0A8T2JWA6_9PIPI|nr:hypothetical protein GDO86_016254 [Hymenochirus boettgeri]
MLSALLLLVVCLCRTHMFLAEDIYCFQSGNCYRIHTNLQNFHNANSLCGSKGSLATMRDQQEEKEILELMSPFHSMLNIYTFWIGLLRPAGNCGLHDRILKGFSWISGGEDSSVNYWNGVPKKKCNVERCVALKAGNNKLVWKDIDCHRYFYSICRFNITWNVSSDVEEEPIKILHPFTEWNTSNMLPEISKIILQCWGCVGNMSLACEAKNSQLLCKKKHCFCGALDSHRSGQEKKNCGESYKGSCLQQCFNHMPVPCTLPSETPFTDVYSQSTDTIMTDTSCLCGDERSPCQGKCRFNASVSPSNLTSMTTKMPPQTNFTTAFRDDESLFETLILPLILGLVALGILVMLLWGGIQMCVRKKKPQRKKSIVPSEAVGNETDSTDHSSSDEEEDTQDRAEVP